MKRIALFILCLYIALSGYALTVTSTAGGLATAITNAGQTLTSVTTLTVSGTMDARDFATIKSMTALYSLDLKNVSIEAYLTNPANKIPAKAFASWSELRSVVLPNGTTEIGSTAFEYNKYLYSVTMPTGLITIGDQAFIGCGFQSITIPNTVTSIGESAFEACDSLYSVSIPSSVTTIGPSAFSYCNSMVSVSIPASVTSIDNAAFGSCPALISVDANNPNYSSVDGVLFNKAKTTLITCPISKMGVYTIPSTVTLLDGYSFYDCNGLTTIITQSATAIALNSTYLFNGLDTASLVIKVPVGAVAAYRAADGWKSFVNIVENGAVGAKTVNVLSTAGGLKSAVVSAGTALTDVKRIIISGQVDARDFAAMRDNMPALRTVDLRNCSIVAYSGTLGTVSSQHNYAANRLPDYAFTKSKLDSIYLPSSATSTGITSFDNSTLSFIDLAHVDTIGMETFNNCNQLKKIDLPSSLKVMGQYAFSNCRYLTGIKIPQGVTSIDSWTFQSDSSLTSISLPNTLKFIGEWGLALTGITSLTIPTSVSDVDYDFAAENESLQTLTILGPVKTLKSESFNRCYALQSIYLPSSLDSIEQYAFSLDTSLTQIYLPQSKPMTIDSTVFLQLKKSDCKLYVPLGAKANYMAMPIWSEFNIMEMDTVKTLTVSAGNLPALFTLAERNMTKKLVLSGAIDLRDIYFMRDSLPNLAVLDLNGVSISEYSGQIDTTLFRAATSVVYAANTLPKAAFKNKIMLRYIKLPASLSVIKNDAFNGCVNLDTIVVNNATPIDLSSTTGVFEGVNTDSCKLVVPSGSSSAYSTASVWTAFFKSALGVENEVSTDNALKVYVENNKVKLNGISTGEILNVYNIQGVTILTQEAQAASQELALPAHGLYIVRVGNRALKFVY